MSLWPRHNVTVIVVTISAMSFVRILLHIISYFYFFTFNLIGFLVEGIVFKAIAFRLTQTVSCVV